MHNEHPRNSGYTGSQVETSPSLSKETPDKAKTVEVFLLEENMISLDTRLYNDIAALKSHENTILIKRLNTLQHELQQKVQRKKQLQVTLSTIKKLNAIQKYCPDSTSTERGIQQWKDKVDFAEIDQRAYMQMVRKLQSNLSKMRENIRDSKEELRSIEQIYVSASETKDELPIEKSTKDPPPWEKLEKAKKELANLQNSIKEIQTRMKYQEEKRKYELLKQERKLKTVNQLKERVIHFTSLRDKLKEYCNEYLKQYSKLARLYKETEHDKIKARREERDIRLQTERNDCSVRISDLQNLKETYHLLTVKLQEMQRTQRKLDEKLKTQKLYDMGEYNVGATSKPLVDLKLNLKRQGRVLEEKMGLIRKVISGIKHILFKLRENDKLDETGYWYDLSVIAAIDDLGAPDLRLKFSRLLLILEQKIKCLCILFLQKTQHMTINMSDIIMEDLHEDVPIDYIEENTIIDCCNSLSQCAESLGYKVGRRSMLSKDSVDLAKQIAISDMFAKKPVTGVEVPKMVNVSKKKQANIVMGILGKELQRKVEQSATPKPYLSTDRDGIERAILNMDMASVNRNPEQIMFRKKRWIIPELAAEKTMPQKADENESSAEKDVATWFKKGRMKLKLDKEIKKRVEYTQAIAQQKEKKKRVTSLTIEVAKEMKERPPEIVYMATTTVNALEKTKGWNDMGPIREIEANRTLVPNFLDVILNMKKSRGVGDIRKIASKSKYLVSPSTPMSTSAGPSVDSIWGIKHRLKNIKSLNKLAVARSPAVTAFDFYYKTSKMPREVKGISRTQSRNNSISTLPSIQQQKKHGRNNYLQKANTATIWEKQNLGKHMLALKLFTKPNKNPQNEIIYRMLSSVSLAYLSESQKKKKKC